MSSSNNIWTLSMPQEFGSQHSAVNEANWQFKFLPSTRNQEQITSWESYFPTLLLNTNTSLAAQLDEVAVEEKDYSETVDIISHLLDEENETEANNGLFQMDLDESLVYGTESSFASEDYSYEDASFDDDSQRVPTCRFFTQGTCKAGAACRYRHEMFSSPSSFDGHRRMESPQAGSADMVCKFWFQGFCRNGADCGFLHDGAPTACSPTLQPMSYTEPYSRNTPIKSRDYQRYHPSEKYSSYGERKPRNTSQYTSQKVCPYYLDGNCKYGSNCRYQHVKPEEARKPKLNEESLKKLSTIPCKYFNHGAGVCPFGSTCYYLHQAALTPTPAATANKTEGCNDSTTQQTVVLQEVECAAK